MYACTYICAHIWQCMCVYVLSVSIYISMYVYVSEYVCVYMYKAYRLKAGEKRMTEGETVADASPTQWTRESEQALEMVKDGGNLSVLRPWGCRESGLD